MIWFVSDEHYYHHNMLMHRESAPHIHVESRKFRTTDEMHLTIKKRHNEVVSKNDTVYHLGDFAYGPGAKSWQQIESLLKVLNGNHILILGNHDHIKPFDYVEAGFMSVHTSLTLDLHQTPDWIGRVTLIHDPAIAGILTDTNFIHGHTHSLGKRLRSNTYCVCVELTDYYPVPITDIQFGGE